MKGGLSCLAACAAFLLGVLVAQPAMAREHIYDKSCVLLSEKPLSFAEAQASGAWDCSPDKNAGYSASTWLRYRFSDSAMPNEHGANLEIDGAVFGGAATVVRFADGSYRVREWPARLLKQYWTAGTRLSLPIYDEGEKPVEVMLRVDRPLSRHHVQSTELAGRAQAFSYREGTMMGFAFITGMFVVSMVYGMAMAIGLRHVVTIYHALSTGLIALYTISSSSMLFVIWPGFSLAGRTAISYASLSLAIAVIGPFCLSFLEREVVSRSMRNAVLSAAGLLAANALLAPLFGNHGAPYVRHLYHLVYVPTMAIYVALMVRSIMKGSRAVWFLVAAWTLPTLAGVDRVLRGLDIYFFGHSADFVFFGTLAFETVVIGSGVAWRIGQIRKQRDNAVKIERELAQLVQTDPLTGLPNRRSFDQRKWRQGDFLAVVDIDHFKLVNDRFGHHAGDQVLRAMGAELGLMVTRSELVGAWRLGGEEFAVLVDGRSAEAAALVLNRMRDRISAAVTTAVPAIENAVTVSAGLSQIGPLGVVQAFESADRALYHAKASGRDRLCFEAAQREIATIFPRRRSRARAA